MAKRRKKKKGRIIIFAIEILLLLVVLGLLFVWSKYQRMGHEEKIDTSDLINTDMDESTQEVLQGFTNIAVFGLDNRSNGSYASGNSDVIMIASINNDTKEVRLASVYRDTFLNVNSDGSYNFRKANYAYNKGGAETAVKMLNQNLDLDIQDFVVVDFNAVTEAIELLGGVEIDITDKELEWMNKQYIPETSEVTGHKSQLLTHTGLQTLDGVQATAYCRIRYTSGGDFKRAQRQREVLSKMVEKAKAADIGTINEIINSVMDDISTDFTLGEMMSLASHLMSYELADTTGFPFQVYTAKLGKPKGDVDVPCDLVKNVTELHQFLFNDYSYTPSNTVQSFSAQIVAETGVGVGDEVSTGVEADTYGTKSSAGSAGTATESESDMPVSDAQTQ